MAKYYYLDGSVSDNDNLLSILHREGGPAVEYDDGSVIYFQNNLVHRLDGPAIIYANGHKEWFINNERLTEEEFEKTILIMKLSGLNKGEENEQ